MQENYVVFYLAGRDDRLLKHDIDTEEIARLVLKGKGTIRELLVKAANSAAEPLRVARKKAGWTEEYADEIKEAGGDAEEAYKCYLEGRIDELAYSLEKDVIDELEVELGGDGDDEGDDDEDDDADGDDEEPVQ